MTPTQQAQTELAEKIFKSLYTELGSCACISDNLPVIFGVKHPFIDYNNFEVDPKLAKSFKKWITDRLSKKRDRFVHLFSFNIIPYIIYLKIYVVFFFLQELVLLQLYRTR